MAQEHEIISPHVVGSALVLDTKVPVQQTAKTVPYAGEETVYHWFRQFRLRLPYFEPILEVWSKWMKPISRIFLIMAKQIGSKLHQVLLKKILWTRTILRDFVSAYSTTNKTPDGWRRCIQGD